MKKVEFLKQPGYIYDLFSLFVCYYNKVDPNSGNVENQANSEKNNDKMISEFGSFPDELLPFFWIKEKNVCFMTENFFVPYKEHFTTTYGLPEVQEALSAYDKTIQKMVLFYFPNISEEECLKCIDSPVAVGRQIKNSNYSAEIKSVLYAFFLEPVPAIQKLSYELMVKEFHLSRFYESKLEMVMALQHDFDIDKFQKNLERYTETQVDFSAFENIYLSFCIYNIKTISLYNNCNKDIVILLGIDYNESLKDLLLQRSSLQLDLIGNALAEKNRIDILNLLLQEGELTVRDFERRLGLSGTNTYYHLSLMQKANVIQTRNQGRTIFYRINKRLFSSLCELLSQYSFDGEEVEMLESLEKTNNYDINC